MLFRKNRFRILSLRVCNHAEWFGEQRGGQFLADRWFPLRYVIRCFVGIPRFVEMGRGDALVRGWKIRDRYEVRCSIYFWKFSSSFIGYGSSWNFARIRGFFRYDVLKKLRYEASLSQNTSSSSRLHCHGGGWQASKLGQVCPPSRVPQSLEGYSERDRCGWSWNEASCTSRATFLFITVIRSRWRDSAQRLRRGKENHGLDIEGCTESRHGTGDCRENKESSNAYAIINTRSKMCTRCSRWKPREVINDDEFAGLLPPIVAGLIMSWPIGRSETFLSVWMRMNSEIRGH